MVGIPASVVRAVTMCTLYVVARCVSRDSAPLHVLSLTALLMLLVRPLYLFDVGFQLSFMAMVAILSVEPYLENLLRRRSLHPVLGYFVSLVCMSLAAQLGTFPLLLYHFGTFPLYFLITNMVAVPLFTVLLLVSVFWWVLALAGFPWLEPFSRLLQNVVQGINACLSHIAQWPGAVLHVAECSMLTMLFIYLTLLFTILFIVKKWPRGLIFALFSLLGLLITFLF
jgi:competence protein ComEC